MRKSLDWMMALQTQRELLDELLAPLPENGSRTRQGRCSTAS